MREIDNRNLTSEIDEILTYLDHEENLEMVKDIIEAYDSEIEVDNTLEETYDRLMEIDEVSIAEKYFERELDDNLGNDFMNESNNLERGEK